jgi:tetratricopeptide (TPR) repeat protein
MEEALQDEWMKSDADRQQGRDAVLWLLDHLEFRIGGRDRKEWGETEIDCWRRGMEIMVSQGYEGDLMPIEECEEIIDKEPWVNEFPISINLQELFLRRRIGALEIRLGLAHSFSQSVAAQLGIILRDKGEYEEAASVLNSAHRAIEETLGSSHPRTLMIATLLATHYRYQGNFAAAEKTLKKTIESQESDPNGTPVAHYGLSILSAILMEIGEVEEAESFRRRNLQVCEKSLGADHPITLRVTKDLGNLLIHLDDLEGAETMLRRALEGYEKLLGVEHVDTLSSLEALGKLMQHRCDFEDAETLLLRAIEGYEKAFGPNHPNTLSCIKNLGELMHEKGDYKSAEKLLRRAHQDMAKALGSDYPATLWFATALGDLLSDKGDHEEAETLYRRVLEIREQKLGLDAPETISSTSHLAVFYWTRSEFSSAENLFRREIESNGRVFGEEGIHTLTSALNLGNLLKEMGNYEEAEELLHRAMEGRKKILGAEHPDTLYSVHCLGDLLVEKGSSVGAEILYRRALAGREKALGSQHPDTLQTVHNLGVAMNLQGYRREAIELLRGYALLSDAAEDALAYNLACYECLEGNHEEAKRLIAKHLTIQPEQKLQALADDDLAAIRDFIQTL